MYDPKLFAAAKSGLTGFGMLMILGSIAGVVREIIFKAIIHGDANFARDVGMVRMDGLLSIRYVRVIWQYKGKHVVKALFIIDFLMFVIMLYMVSLVIPFISTGLKFLSM